MLLLLDSQKNNYYIFLFLIKFFNLLYFFLIFPYQLKYQKKDDLITTIKQYIYLAY